MDYGKLTKDQLSILLEDKGIPYSSSWTKEKMEEKLIEFEENKIKNQKTKNDLSFKEKMNGKLPHIIVSSVLAIIFSIITIIMIAGTEPYAPFDPYNYNNYSTMLPIDITSFIITIIILIVLLIFIAQGFKSENKINDKSTIGIQGKVGAGISLFTSIVGLLLCITIIIMTLSEIQPGDHNSIEAFWAMFETLIAPIAACILNITLVSLYLKNGLKSSTLKTAAAISSIFAGLIVSTILIFMD